MTSVVEAQPRFGEVPMVDSGIVENPGSLDLRDPPPPPPTGPPTESDPTAATTDPRQHAAVHAGRAGDIRALYLLSSEGVDLGAVCAKTHVCAMEAAVQNRQWHVMRYLNYAGVDVNRPLSQSGITPLHYAIAMGDLDEAEWLCNHGALLGVKAARFRSSGADTQPDAWQQNARSANEIDAHGSPGIPGHQRMLRGLLSAGQLAQETLPGRQADRLRSLARFHERHHRVSLLPWLNQGILILTTLTVDEVLELGYSAHFGVPGAATGGVPVTIALNRPVVILGLVGLWLLSLFTLVAVMKGPGRAVVSAEERTGTFCSSCKAYRPKRARHCYFSGHCVPDYNLYCHVLKRCIGKGNHGAFMGWLATNAALMVLVAAVTFSFGQHGRAAAAACMAYQLLGALFQQVRAWRVGMTVTEYANRNLPEAKYIL